MSEKEQQFERIYKETENFGRTQFVREIQMQINDNKKKDKEIERLNNIINEFMEELKWQRKVSLSLNESFAVSRIDTLINKLQELKGSE